MVKGKLPYTTISSLSDPESGTILFKTQRMTAGDVILVPAYLWHWHGAIENGNFSHYQIKKIGDTIWFE